MNRRYALHQLRAAALALVLALALALVLAVGLLLSGCVAPADDDGEPFSAIMTIPAVVPARAAAVQSVCRLPGVDRVSTAYYEPAAVLDMWVYYQPVPDRWPFDEKVILAVDSAVERYAPTGERTTLRVRIIQPNQPTQPNQPNQPGQASATRPSSAFDASASCDGKIRTV